jgi:hypothetical protein
MTFTARINAGCERSPSLAVINANLQTFPGIVSLFAAFRFALIAYNPNQQKDVFFLEEKENGRS